MKNINIVIMGAPNSGKGTVCESLCKEFNLFHLSTGQILRDNIEKNTPLGKIVKPYMRSVVPDDLVTQMVLEQIKSTEGFNGVVFDGYPRTMPQALALDNNVKIDLIILLDYEKEEEEKLIARAISRVVCTKCKATLSKSMLNNGNCPHCGAKTTVRDDANEKIAKARMEVFKQVTVPVVEHYSNRIVKINAFIGKENVWEKVKALVLNLLERE